jgi:OmpA-OmpF porin, OOP family
MKIALAVLFSLASVSASAKSTDFPDIDSSWRHAPEILHMPSLQRVAVGMDKRQIYHILGTPHFREGLGARRWVYWYAKAEANCLYKITFDRGKVASLDWNTSVCGSDINKQ